MATASECFDNDFSIDLRVTGFTILPIRNYEP